MKVNEHNGYVTYNETNQELYIFKKEIAININALNNVLVDSEVAHMDNISEIESLVCKIMPILLLGLSQHIGKACKSILNVRKKMVKQAYRIKPRPII